MRHHQRERIVRARLDGGENVGERETLVAQARRALAPLPPDAADATLLADTLAAAAESAAAPDDQTLTRDVASMGIEPLFVRGVTDSI